MDEAVQVTIDREECISCGVCWDTCPDFFEESPDDGLSQVVEMYQVDGDPGKGSMSQDLEDCVTEAADGCPVGIIHIHK